MPERIRTRIEAPVLRVGTHPVLLVFRFEEISQFVILALVLRQTQITAPLEKPDDVLLLGAGLPENDRVRIGTGPGADSDLGVGILPSQPADLA